jgi:tRNA A-37 threonylcarbamoyl transferase component Bud32
VSRAINPYLNRTAIRNDRAFFGRRRELETIFSRIDAPEPQSVSVVGERRIGKSSLLRALLRRKQLFLRRPDEFVFAYLDLHEKVHGDVSHLFSGLLEQIGLGFQDLEMCKTAATYENIRAAVARTDRTGFKLVLVLDEFEAVTQNENFTLEFFSFLRSLPNNYAVSFIVSSAREIQELCHSKEVAGSPFFNIFHKLNLGSFAPDEAAQLIVEPSTAAGYSLEPYVDPIIETGGYFPFFLQIACCAFFENRNDLKEVHAKFYEQARDHFVYVWKHLSDRERTACTKISTRQALSEQDRSFVGALSRRGYVYQQIDGVRLFSSAFDDFVKARNADALLSATSKDVQDAAPGFVGKRIERFIISKILGSGGMGEVYLAKDTKLKRFVALKRIAGHLRENPECRRQFLNEAERASQLNHPSIVRIYDVIEERADVFVIMEYVEGATLRCWSAPIALEKLLHVARQCAEALACAHRCGILHGDLKPENILVTPEGHVKILDFGLAKYLPRKDDQNVTRTFDHTISKVIGGTLAYMAPELILERPPDARADIFSLGVVLYELWSGNHPFLSTTAIETANRILHIPPSPLRHFLPDTPVELELAIGKCLSKNPSDRYADVLELLSDLTKVKSARAQSAH